MRMCKWASMTGILFLSGCASLGLLTPGENQWLEARNAISAGNDAPALRTTPEQGEPLASALNRARLLQVEQRFEESRVIYDGAISAMQKMQQGPLVDASDLGAQGLSLLTNDTVLPFQPAPYEQHLTHVYQALNHVFLGDIEAAGVEARRADLVDRDIARKYHAALAKAQDKERPDTASARTKLSEQFFTMSEKAAEAQSAITSAYGYVLSGWIYERRGELNDAYIDYKKALSLSRGNDVLRRRAFRLATQLGLREDAIQLAGKEPPAAAGNVLVIHEQGWAPEKEEVSFPLQLANGGLVVLALPGYFHFATPKTLTISADGAPMAETEPLSELQALAARALQDKQWLILGRMIARAATKAAIQRRSEEEAGLLGLFVSSLYNVVSEQADLRAWLTLPAFARIASLDLPDGQQTLMLTAGDGATATINLELRANQQALVYVVDTGQHLFITQHVYP